MTDEFIIAASAPRSAHTTGALEDAEAILATYPEVATGGIYAAAILGDSAGVQRLLAEDRARATSPGGPYGWDALTYLCFSRYLRLRGSDDFVRAAEALLDAGADPNTGFFEHEHEPEPTFESALYGAAGVAHHAGLTRLLLARGADPNLGGEVAYHAPEGFDNDAMKAVVRSGRVTNDGLTTMLHRKLDWTDLEGVRWLLEHGADPNALSAWGDRALHHSLARDNALALLEGLLDHGADPSLRAPRHEGRSAATVAARAGRADALELFDARGFRVEFEGDDAFFAMLSRANRPGVLAFLATEPGIVTRLESAWPGVVATLAGAGNAAAVGLALDLGFPLSADALSLAVWRERTQTVRLLLARGAPVTPPVLSLAERALTEMSEWTPHHSRAIVDALQRIARGA
ncbi:MAG TPA: ankyrin repeat domain-containing protein [Solirubrobacteraceae bacterium]